MWFDNHCHLTSMKQDPETAIEAARLAGVTRLLTVGCSVPDSAAAAEIASLFPHVWSTAGVHPHEASQGTDGLEDLLDHPSVVAVGECGLDYHYDHSPRPDQVDSFVRQIGLAKEHELALVIHTREAWEDTFRILDEQGIPDRTVFHCFTGGAEEATAAVRRGAYVSFSGIVTFKTAEDLRAAAAVTPLDRILVETDSPYLAPEPHRGKPNQPANVAVIGRYLAELLDQPVEDFAGATTANANTLFGLA